MDQRFSKEKKLMKCLSCRGILKKGHTSFRVERKGFQLFFESIPAWVCSQCGEALLEEFAVKTIQDATEAFEKKTRKLLAA